MSNHRLPRPYMTILMQFEDAGGSGLIDMHGRVVVGETRHPIAGDSTTWLHLVAAGYVAGEDGKLLVTQAGRDAVEMYRSGMTREGI